MGQGLGRKRALTRRIWRFYMRVIFSRFIAIAFLFCVSFGILSCSSSKVVKRTISDEWVECTKDNSNNCGYFFTSDEIGQLKMFEGEFKKNAGYDSSCFGFIFGYSSSKDGIVSDYIRFEINTLGEMALYSFDGTNYKDYLDATSDNNAYLVQNPSINKGMGATNKLKVEKNSDGTYNCYINGVKVASEIPALKNGKNGVMAFFSVGKQDEEKFPEEPVDFSYRITGYEWANSLY